MTSFDCKCLLIRLRTEIGSFLQLKLLYLKRQWLRTKLLNNEKKKDTLNVQGASKGIEKEYIE